MMDKGLVDTIFIQLFNMSVAAGWLILAVIALRLFMRKAPRWICCVLWAIVAVRLVCPVSLESVFSLVPSAETISFEGEIMSEITSGVPLVDDTLNPMIENTISGSVDRPVRDVMTPSTSPLIKWTHTAGIVWAAGFVALLTAAILGYLRMRRTLREAVLWQDNIWFCDQVKSPFILGIFRPGIYLPSDIGQEQMDYVLAHERAHLKRKDHLWKALGYLLLAVYWFHPLVWVAFILLCRDIEVACDEKVIRNLDMGERKAYSRALLSCSQQRRMVIAYPLAFGEVGVKERVRSVLRYKKPAFWAAGAAIAVCAVVAVCFLTNPEQPEDGTLLPPEDLDESGTDYVLPETEIASRPGTDTSDGFWEGDINSPGTDNHVLPETEIVNKPEAEEETGSGTDESDPEAEDTDSPETQAPDSMETQTPDSSEPQSTAEPEPEYIARPGINTGYPGYDALIAEVQDMWLDYDYYPDGYPDKMEYHFCKEFYMMRGYQPECLGYLLRDLDGNGVEELIFGENGNDAWNGVVYDLYTIVDGNVVHVFSGGSRCRYLFCENGCIANEGSSSAFESEYAYYTYRGTELTLVEAVIFYFGKIFYSTEYPYYLEEYPSEIYQEITEEEAEEITEKYVYEVPQFTSFVVPLP